MTSGAPLLDKHGVAGGDVPDEDDFRCPRQRGAMTFVGLALVCVATLMADLFTTRGSTQKLDPDSEQSTARSELGMAELEPLTIHKMLVYFVQFAGFGQLALVTISPAIPFVLDWKGQFKNNTLLLYQEFVVYAGYILCINLSFGLLSCLAPSSLVEVGFHQSIITGFIFLYWAARVAVQSFVFDLRHMSKPHEVMGRRGIEMLFVYLTIVYGLAFAYDLGWLPSFDSATPSWLCSSDGSIRRMFIAIVLLFMVMKVLVSSVGDGPQMTWTSTMIFFFVWPGMRTSVFTKKGKAGASPCEKAPSTFYWSLDDAVNDTWKKDLAWGVLFVILGALLCVPVKVLSVADRPFAAGLLALSALSMMGHVGALRILRGAMRMMGYEVEQLFVDPLLATSLGEFWGKRWNIAFSDMNRAVFVASIKAALKEFTTAGRQTAALAGIFTSFVASALMHEIGITVPVLSGFGGPTLYFVMQGAFVVIEKQRPVAEWLGKHKMLARLWVIAALLIPMPICFVEQFRSQIALPITLMVGDFLYH